MPIARPVARWSVLLFAALAAACSSMPQGERSFPKTTQDELEANRGKLTGEDGGWALFGGDKKDTGATIGVNAFLWRATLDTLSFLPIASADPFGGTVLTDWYEDPQAKGERFKVNALILDKDLRADGIKIKLFKQARAANGAWADTPTNPRAERDLEDAILTRARQIKVQSIAAE